MIAAGTAPTRNPTRARIRLTCDLGPAGPGRVDVRVVDRDAKTERRKLQDLIEKSGPHLADAEQGAAGEAEPASPPAQYVEWKEKSPEPISWPDTGGRVDITADARKQVRSRSEVALAKRLDKLIALKEESDWMIHISSRRIQAFLSTLVMATLLLIPAIALANGTPIRVPVAYQPPYSNAGPEDATGTVEIAFDDGEVHGDIEGLPAEAGTQYEVWLYNTNSEDILSLTTFEADESGTSRFDALFDEPIPEDGWDLVVITIEDDPDSSPDPDSRWSLVGAFSDADVEAEVGPAELPRTGSQPAPDENAAMYGALVLGGALAAGIVIALGVPPARERES